MIPRSLQSLRPLLVSVYQCRSYSDMQSVEKAMTKFWKSVRVEQRPDSKGVAHNVVTLDGKPVKTPGGFTLFLPTSKPALAHLICHEWSILTTQKIKHHSLPLTSIAARAVDFAYDENAATLREKVTHQLMPYLDTDTLLTFAPFKDCDGNLRPAQEELYPPVIDEAQQTWGVTLHTLDTEHTLFGSRQTDATKRKVLDWMNRLDPWQFTALEKATISAKSLIAGMNIVNHTKTPDEIADLVNLETKLQTEQWGEVEDTHDVDFADIRRTLGSCYLLAA